MPLPPFLRALRSDYFFHGLLATLALLTAFGSAKIATYATLVDWPTIATLAGLLLLTKSLEMSGCLTHLGTMLIARLPSERLLALFLVAATALLSMVLTNDVALFVVVPLTIGLRATLSLPTVRLVVFEALAANAGSAFTPIGNPQNLFLWQFSHSGFAAYCLAMLPLLLIVMLLLAALCFVAFPALRIVVQTQAESAPVNKVWMWVAMLLYLPFLVCADLHHAFAALCIIGVTFLVLGRRVLVQTDWGLILVFVLMFIDLRLVAQLPQVQGAILAIGLADPVRLYFSGIVASQLISNVPAAILLAEYSKDWRMIAYAVNIGGFGFVMGSLANIIALRLVRERAAWVVFHLYSIPFLFASAALGYLYLFFLQG
ncbi:MAG TPA: SLC13 family permease [Burkholderiaceae bacterium]